MPCSVRSVELPAMISFPIEKYRRPGIDRPPRWESTPRAKADRRSAAMLNPSAEGDVPLTPLSPRVNPRSLSRLERHFPRRSDLSCAAVSIGLIASHISWCSAI